jgi:hypothetical protein
VDVDLAEAAEIRKHRLRGGLELEVVRLGGE